MPSNFGTPLSDSPDFDQSLLPGARFIPLYAKIFVEPWLPALDSVVEKTRQNIASGLFVQKNPDGTTRIIRRNPNDDVLIVPEGLLGAAA